ncbi:MAG: hypothetical protein ACRCU0_05975, partial [Candidatus Rhabdochlamydia sp.]
TSTEEPTSTTEVTSTSPVFMTQSSTSEDATSTEEPTSTTEITSTSPAFMTQSSTPITQLEESSTLEDTIPGEMASVFTAEQFKRSTIEDTDVVLSDTTEKLMAASTDQGFLAKTITGSMGVFLAVLTFLGLYARKRQSGVYRTGEEMKNFIPDDDSFIVDFQDTEESKI